MNSQSNRDLERLEKASRFFNLLQIKKNQEVYLSLTHTARLLYADFSEIYVGNATSSVHVYIDQKNINFHPSHLNIPIFPPEEKLIRAYAAIVAYYGSSIDIVVYDESFVSECTWTIEIWNLRFFDTFFEIEHAVMNLKFKLSQWGSLNYLLDANRIITYYRIFLKYLEFRNNEWDVFLREKISVEIFWFLHTYYGNSYQWIPWNIWKWIKIWKARILDRNRLNFQNEWYNNFDTWDIIIANNTHVSYMRYIFSCGGIITENHNLLSHASLISRELWIPLVLWITDITLRIFDGDLIEMNSDTGKVKILQRFWEK